MDGFIIKTAHYLAFLSGISYSVYEMNLMLTGFKSLKKFYHLDSFQKVPNNLVAFRQMNIAENLRLQQ